MKFTTLSLTGVLFIALGVLCAIIQKIFYGWVDANGFVHDSLFLPLTYLFLAIGVILLLISILISNLERNRPKS